MKILQVGKYDPRKSGGIERFIGSLSQGLVERGQKVKCAFSGCGLSEPPERRNGVEMHPFPSLGKISSLDLTLWDYKKLSKWKPDIIHFHLPNPLALKLLKPIKGPRVITYHADLISNPWMEYLYKKNLQSNLRKSDHIVFTSQTLKMNNQLSFIEGASSVIPIGVNDLKENTNLETTEIFDFIFVGRLVKYKGLVELLRELKNFNGSLGIIGEGPLEQTVKQEIKKRGLQNKIKLLGYREDGELANIIKSSKALILPSQSRAEAFGLSLIEAMLKSKPVITYELPTGVTEVNIHNKTGLVVPLGDAKAFVVAMNGLLENKTLRLDLGRAAQDRVQRLFKKSLMIDKYIELYGRLLSRR